MRRQALMAPLVILAADLSPISVQPDSAGRYRLTVGGAMGQYEGRRLSCSGDVLESWPVRERSLGVEAEVWPSPDIRISGWITRDGSDQEYTIMGFLVAGEWRHFGAGAGFNGSLGSTENQRLGLTDDETDHVPFAAYLRAGTLDRLHARFELTPPGPLGSSTGLARLGLGYNQGWRRGIRWQAGASINQGADEAYPVGAYVEGAFPVGADFEIRSSAHWRPSHRHTDANFGVGLRWSPGSP